MERNGSFDRGDKWEVHALETVLATDEKGFKHWVMIIYRGPAY